MSSTVAYGTTTRAAAGLPLRRWAALAALLVGELLLLTVWFDMGALAGQDGWWADVLEQLPKALRVGLAAAGAALLLSGRRLWDELRRAHTAARPPARARAFLLAHFTTLALFTATTSYLLDGGLRRSGEPLLWVAAWVALAALTLAFWGLAVLPGDAWGRLAARTWPALLAAAGVGLGAWVAGMVAKRFWTRLGLVTLWTVNGLLHGLYADTVCQPAAFVVGTPDFTVTIAPHCSGYEGIGLAVVFLGAYLWFFRQNLRFPRAFLLVPLAAALAWLGNAVRIVGLIALGTAGWRDVALGGFHSQAGWLAFIAVALGLVAVSSRSRFFSASAPARGPGLRADPTAAHLVPFLAVLATGMLTAAFSAGFDRLAPLRLVAGAAALAYFWPTYAGLRPSRSWEPAALGTGVFFLWIVLAPAAGTSSMDGVVYLPAGWAAAWLALRTVGYVIITPVVEELAFRGYLIRRLMAADFSGVPTGRFSWPAFVISSVLFGLLHGDRWLAGTLAGMAFALALRRRGRLGDAVVAHAVANGLIAGYAFISGDWSAWS